MRLRSERSGRGVAALTLAAIVAGVVLSATPASAHDTATGAITLVVNERRIAATAPVPFTELGYVDTNGDGLLDADELDAQEADIAPTLVATVRDRVRLTIDGEDAEIIGAGVPSISATGATSTTSEGTTSAGATSAGATSEGIASANVTLVFASGPHDGDVSDVALEWTFDSPQTAVVLSHPDGVISGQLGGDRTVDFSLGAWSSASSFFTLGIEHIRFGPDHLLFLLVLTLTVAGASVSTGSAWRTLKLVTAFTIGHAISLCLAYFDLISVPAAIVEPAISLSIVAAAVLAIWGRATHARPWIAAVIGVVHGLGFASSLASIGVATTQRAPALAAFNLGIDVAQTVVVLVVLGALWLASRTLTNRMVWVTIPTAAFAGVVGLAWTATRLSGIQL